MNVLGCSLRMDTAPLFSLSAYSGPATRLPSPSREATACEVCGSLATPEWKMERRGRVKLWFCMRGRTKRKKTSSGTGKSGVLPGHAQSATGRQVGDVGDPTRQLGGLRRGLGAEDGVKVHGEGWLWMERERRIQMELCTIEEMRHITHFLNRGETEKQRPVSTYVFNNSEPQTLVVGYFLFLWWLFLRSQRQCGKLTGCEVCSFLLLLCPPHSSLFVPFID